MRKYTQLVLLALLVTAQSGVIEPSQTAMAQMVGPPAPQEKPSSEQKSFENVKNAFKNFFEKDEKKEETTEEAQETGPKKPLSTVPDRPGVTEAKPVVKKEEPPTRMEAPKRPPLLTQPPLLSPDVEKPALSEEDPPNLDLPTIDNPDNPLGYMDAQLRLNKVAEYIDKKEYFRAKIELNAMKPWLVDATEAHIGLYKALEKIPSARAQAELEKHLALKFATLRDKAFFQMGTVFVAENNHKSAIKELTEVVKSQPRSDLGLQAYEILQEIGFTQKLQIAE